ncbi:MAG: tRNA cyclic N6-threonylcarbamoyladenosine(37) synthase TcdA [Proteobacteria bacterium]|nr:MAG: tRNA cyclic N6-threonylcarbamoyladenosine(37) synthase TcdA [Pseudomonadota bacterium]
MIETKNYDLQRRFGGIARTYGAAALQGFMQAHVCIVGVGGVGSWAVEALARSGIGRLTLIDLDNVAESNINRQLPALSSTVGAPKIEVLGQRVLDINPECRLMLIEDFVEVDNVSQMLTTEMDYVVDCIDNFRIKAAIIAHCRRHKIKIITLGGTGGQRDPRKIRLGDLSRSQHDPLLSRVRKQLRQTYHFPRNPKRRFEVACVWSEEQMLFPAADGTLTAERPDNKTGNSLSCAGGLGSIMTVTASFALLAVSHVLGKIASSS